LEIHFNFFFSFNDRIIQSGKEEIQTQKIPQETTPQEQHCTRTYPPLPLSLTHTRTHTHTHALSHSLSQTQIISSKKSDARTLTHTHSHTFSHLRPWFLRVQVVQTRVVVFFLQQHYTHTLLCSEAQSILRFQTLNWILVNFKFGILN